MFDHLFTLTALFSLLTLTVMEIVLGIDNIIFISIVTGKLPPEKQAVARKIGLGLALLIRIGLLFLLSFLKTQDKPLFHIFNLGFSLRDLILLAGGLFLMTKTVTEIHEKLEGEETHANPKPLSFSSAVTQIVLLDIVFSFDSILTAIGIADEVMIMVAAVVISLGIMLVFAGKVADFVNKHPSIKMLALSFLLMIGMLLTMEGLPDSLHLEVPKGYVYFAMAFSFLVEMLNLRMKKKSKNTVQLRNNTIDEVRDDYYEEEPKNPNL